MRLDFSKTNFKNGRYELSRGGSYAKDEYIKMRKTHDVLTSLIENLNYRYVGVYNYCNSSNRVIDLLDLKVKDKKEYEKFIRLDKWTKKLERHCYNVENYMNYKNYIKFLEKNGVSFTSVNKIEGKINKNNPIKELKNFVKYSQKKIIPLVFETGKNAYYRDDYLSTIILGGNLLYGYSYQSIDDFFNHLEKSVELLKPYDDEKKLNESVSKVIDVYSQKLKNYKNINNFLNSQGSKLDKESKSELTGILYEHKEIIKLIKELSVLKYSKTSLCFPSVQLYDLSIEKRIDSVCDSLEKEINKRVEKMNKRYDKVVSKLSPEKQVELTISKKSDSRIKAELDRLYQEILEERRRLRSTSDSEKQTEIMLHIDDIYEKMKVILIKYPEIKASQYEININKDNFEETYNSTICSPEKKEAIKYRIYKEYILYCSSEKNKKDIISFEDYAMREYNLAIDVPEDFQHIYEDPNGKKRK